MDKRHDYYSVNMNDGWEETPHKTHGWWTRYGLINVHACHGLMPWHVVMSCHHVISCYAIIFSHIIWSRILLWMFCLKCCCCWNFSIQIQGSEIIDTTTSTSSFNTHNYNHNTISISFLAYHLPHVSPFLPVQLLSLVNVLVTHPQHPSIQQQAPPPKKSRVHIDTSPTHINNNEKQ